MLNIPGTSIRNMKKRSKLTQDTSPTLRPKEDWIILEHGQVLDDGTIFDSIQPIISKEVFDKAQEVRLAKKGLRRGAWRGKDIFVTKLVCEKCGKHFIHDYFKTADKSTEYYRCQTKKRFGVKTCNAPNILKSTITNILTNDYVNEVVFRLKGRIIQHYNLKLATITDSMDNNVNTRIAQLIEANRALKEQNMKVLDLYLSELLDKDMFAVKQDEINNKLKQNEEELQLLQTPLLEKQGAIDEINEQIKQVQQMSINNTYTNEEIYNMVETIHIFPARYLTIDIRINGILFEDDTKYYF